MKFDSKKLVKFLVIAIFAFAIFYYTYSDYDYNDYAETANNGIVAENQIRNDHEYHFKSEENRMKHFEKHGVEMGFKSAEDYEMAASLVVNNPESLHKLEAEDGDDVYYLERTNEFVIVSTKGYIRTYFYPERGIDYYNSQ